MRTPTLIAGLQNQKPRLTAVLKPVLQKTFTLDDLSVYSKTLTIRDTNKFENLIGIMYERGRRDGAYMRDRALQSGGNGEDWSDSDDYKAQGKAYAAYAMIIKDWQQTPIYHMLIHGMPIESALGKYSNKTTLNRLANDIKDRLEDE